MPALRRLVTPTVCSDAQGANSHFEVLAGDEVAEARVERHDVVVLEVDLDEGLPVVVALVDLDAVQHVVGEVEVAHAEAREVRADVALAVEQQSVPVLQRALAEVEARLVGEMRRPEELALEVVGPAMDRADDVLRVAAALEHDRLPVPADVRQELDAAGVADERLRVVAPLEDVIVAGVRHHELVPDVTRRAGQQEALLGFVDCGIAVPGHRKLRRGGTQTVRRGEVRHQPALSHMRAVPRACRAKVRPTNPTQQPGTITAQHPA